MIIIINQKAKGVILVSVLLVGADRLGKIPEVLNAKGINKYVHVPGRKKGMRKFKVPKDVDLVIVFTDFIEHCVSKNIKAQLKQMDIPCVYSKRSVTDLTKKLDACMNCGMCELPKS